MRKERITMPGKKTGLYLSLIAEEIVNKVAEKFGYTSLSNTVNYIILEYDRLANQKQEVVEVKEELKPQAQLSDWFVAEDK